MPAGQQQPTWLPVPSSFSNMHAVLTPNRVTCHIDIKTRYVMRDLGALVSGRKIVCSNVHSVDFTPWPAADCLIPGKRRTTYALPVIKSHVRVQSKKTNPA